MLVQIIPFVLKMFVPVKPLVLVMFVQVNVFIVIMLVSGVPRPEVLEEGCKTTCLPTMAITVYQINVNLAP